MDVTVAVTSFLRFGYLAKCLQQLHRCLPECKIIVADDSYSPPTVPSYVKLITLPFDSGLSAKRNAIVKACDTKYLLMYSDDFATTSKSAAGVQEMVDILDENADIAVAGGVHNNQPYQGFLRWVPGKYIKETRLYSHDLRPFYNVDLTVNYFLARISAIKDIPWDNRMKIGGEHGDWFLELKLQKKRVVWVPGVNVDSLPRIPDGENPEYGNFRGRARTLGHPIFLKKRKIKTYYGFDDEVKDESRNSDTLIAIVSCEKNAAKVRSQLSTWIPKAHDAGYDVQVFTGPRLGVGDGYGELIDKVQAVCKWALAHGYKHILKTDDDIHIHPHLLPKYRGDYAGRPCVINDFGQLRLGIPNYPAGTFPYQYVCGGGYWLSRRAMRIVVKAPRGNDWAEDRFVGQALARAGIKFKVTPYWTQIFTIQLAGPDHMEIYHETAHVPTLIKRLLTPEERRWARIKRLPKFGVNVIVVNEDL